MSAAFKLNEVSLYALPAIRYAIPPNQMTDDQKCEKIFEYISHRFQIHAAIIKGHARNNRYVYPRHIAMYAFKKKTELSLSAIGRYFKKKHTTVISGIKAIKNYIDTNEEKKAEIEYILANCLL